MMSGSLSSLFWARYPALACGSDCPLSPQALLLSAVTLVAYLIRFFTKGDCGGASLHGTWNRRWPNSLGHLGGYTHDYVWELALGCKSVKQVVNVTFPPALSHPLLTLFLRRWISSPTSVFIVRRFVCLLAS
jgi:hypothetical protein